jgi:hypothetical protein
MQAIEIKKGITHAKLLGKKFRAWETKIFFSFPVAV